MSVVQKQFNKLNYIYLIQHTHRYLLDVYELGILKDISSDQDFFDRNVNVCFLYNYRDSDIDQKFTLVNTLFKHLFDCPYLNKNCYQGSLEIMMGILISIICNCKLNRKYTFSKNNYQEYIYLIKKRISVDKNESVYKVGLTKKKYPLDHFNMETYGYEIHMIIGAQNVFDVEEKINTIFNQKFTLINYGKETFEGDRDEMINIIMNEINLNNCKKMNSKNNTTHISSTICCNPVKNKKVKKNKKEYYCFRCSYNTKIKRNFNRHLKRTRPCIPEYLVVDRSLILSNYDDYLDDFFKIYNKVNNIS